MKFYLRVRVRNKDFQVLLSQLAVFVILFPIVAYKKHMCNMNKYIFTYFILLKVL